MELNDFLKNTAFSQTYVRLIGGIFFLVPIFIGSVVKSMAGSLLIL